MFMRKLIPGLALVFFVLPALNVHAMTILVNSVQAKEFKDLTLEEKKAITGIENGVMDTLFEAGFIFFSQYMKADSGEAFDTARAAGADYLLVLKPDCQTGDIVWHVYRVSGREMVGHGTIVRKNMEGVEQMSDSEFYYHTGELIGHDLVECARKQGGS